MTLTNDDFPLYVSGCAVWNRGMRRFLFSANDGELARDLVLRLNRDHAQSSTGYRSSGELVYG